jgi:alkaline phosphatase D
MNRYRRRACTVVAACLVATAVPAPALAQSVIVTHGPLVGAATGHSATVWFRLGAPAQVRVRYHAGQSTLWTYAGPVPVTADTDGTGRIALAGLLAGKTYTYQVGVTGPEGVEVWGGGYAFRLNAATDTSLSFAVLADFSNKLKDSAALRDALARRPAFLVAMGDLDHRNPATDPTTGYYPQQDAPQVLADLRAMHRDTRDFATPIGHDFATGLVGAPDSGVTQIPLYYAWDDHDFCANNADSTCPFAAQAVQAFREYMVPPADNGIDGAGTCPQASDYQRIDHGLLASVFLLDARSARTADHASMLGACQYGWLTRGLADSKATWKIVLTPVPFNPTTKTWDAWGQFPSERASLVDFIQRKGIRNVVFLSGDVHSGGAIDDGTHSSYPEVAVPHANMPNDWINTFCRSSSRTATAYSEPGLWTIGTLTEPDFGGTTPTCAGDPLPAGTTLVGPPPGVYPLTGKGNAGYVRVDVTATTFDAAVIGADGKYRMGVVLDGTPTPLALHLVAQ